MLTGYSLPCKIMQTLLTRYTSFASPLVIISISVYLLLPVACHDGKCVDVCVVLFCGYILVACLYI